MTDLDLASPLSGPASPPPPHQELDFRKVVVGQEDAIDGMIVALLARGHVLLEGVPGTAKTLMVRTLAASVGLSFRRIQFTPDLMPSDVVGTHIFDLQDRRVPLDARAHLHGAAAGRRDQPRAGQDAERAARGDAGAAGLDRWQAPRPGEHFTVFATQNPVEQEGTYPLPEAQLDRFLLKIKVGYPSAAEEDRILAAATAAVGSEDVAQSGVQAVATPAMLDQARALGAHVRVEEPVRRYVRDLVRATRESSMVVLGAGPRAGVHLMVAARWAAVLEGRAFVTPDDVVRMLPSVIAHRLILSPDVELDGLDGHAVLQRIAATVDVPR
jgi:MoxR-like ATPase